ncbi:MAG: hypothetical protein CMO81_07930 [Waddliaceae bacterium]|nr:hypothetical protein [Waddliaceae bacterium]
MRAKSLALAGGVFWSASVFLMTFFATYFGYGVVWTSMFIDLYPGYSLSFLGALIGAAWGFTDGFICLYIFGWLYNYFDR